MIALDTNVWIYLHDVRDPGKQQRARELVASSEPIALLWQVGCEFIAATRKLESQGFSREAAWDALDDMRALAGTTVLPGPHIWDEARRLQDERMLSFWDAMILAACCEGGVTRLYSEDLVFVGSLGGLEVINPFS